MAEGEPVTIRWWHISTAEDQAAMWQSLADQYTAEHPNVTFEITILENEAFKQRLTTVMQGGDPPDLFQSWGGGVLWEFANAGLVRDISSELEGEWRETIAAQSALELYGQNGEYYGVPFEWGAVGLFQNLDLFEQAGLDGSCPATYDDLLANVQTIKDAGITPIALGEGDKWPGHFWWVYLAIREGGKDAFLDAYTRNGSFTDEPFVRAGQKLAELVALEPFQDGYLGLTYSDEAALFGNGQAAMELMGQWGPNVSASNSESGDGVANLAWCPFPIVEGGAGNPGDVLGGGDGIAVGKNAPDEAIDFLRFVTSVDGQRKSAAVGMTPVTVKGLDEETIDSEWLQSIVDARNNAPYFQLYYDQFLPPAVGGTVNDAVEQIFAGAATPEEAAQQIEDSAALELSQ
jgi:raffinose/stachyose/melibiose transport system substrate-binding protein